METPKQRNTLKVTINPDSETELDVVGWTINYSGMNGLEKESERVGVERRGRYYSLVFSPEGPILEIWEVEENGDLAGQIHNIRLPNE